MKQDNTNIFNLYLESKEQPQMHVGADGNKRWLLHGKLHREDGPAYVGAYGTKEWWLHDKLHREDGAAIEGVDGTKEWWLHNKRYETPEQWAQALLKQRRQPHDADAVNDLLTMVLNKYIE